LSPEVGRGDPGWFPPVELAWRVLFQAMELVFRPKPNYLTLGFEKKITFLNPTYSCDPAEKRDGRP
jgi:hypothetical protein